MIVKFYFADPLVWWKKPGNLLLKIGDEVSAGHFAIGLETYGEEQVYESVFPRSKKSPISEWLTHYKIVKQYQFYVPQHLQYKVLEWLEGYLNVRYAVEQILFIALCILFTPIDLLLRTAVLNHNKALVCTELGSRFIDRFFHFMIKKSHDRIGLNDMFRFSDCLEDKVMWKQD
jgi:hypothetical protein